MYGLKTCFVLLAIISVIAIVVMKCGRFCALAVEFCAGVVEAALPFDVVVVGMTTILLSESFKVRSRSKRRATTRPRYRILIPLKCIAVESVIPSITRALGPKNVEPLSKAIALWQTQTLF